MNKIRNCSAAKLHEGTLSIIKDKDRLFKEIEHI